MKSEILSIETTNKLSSINKALEYIDERMDILNRIEVKVKDKEINSPNTLIEFEKETLRDLKDILGGSDENK